MIDVEVATLGHGRAFSHQGPCCGTCPGTGAFASLLGLIFSPGGEKMDGFTSGAIDPDVLTQINITTS